MTAIDKKTQLCLQVENAYKEAIAQKEVKQGDRLQREIVDQGPFEPELNFNDDNFADVEYRLTKDAGDFVAGEVVTMVEALDILDSIKIENSQNET
jgi:hypothetical protein